MPVVFVPENAPMNTGQKTLLPLEHAGYAERNSVIRKHNIAGNIALENANILAIASRMRGLRKHVMPAASDLRLGHAHVATNDIVAENALALLHTK